MRYAERVGIPTLSTDKVYNEETGDYESVEQKYNYYACNVTYTPYDVQSLMYGQIKTEALNIRLNNKPTEVYFPTVIYNDKVYKVYRARKTRRDFIMEVYLD